LKRLEKGPTFKLHVTSKSRRITLKPRRISGLFADLSLLMLSIQDHQSLT